MKAEAQNLNQGKRVLFISSYSYGWDTVQTQIEGIKAGVDENTTIDYEFMDTKRFRTDEWLNMFHDMLKYHLENTDPYDVVIVEMMRRCSLPWNTGKNCSRRYRLSSKV